MKAVWHGHHNVLISWLESIQARVADIKANKSECEHAIRLRLIKPVVGELPEELVIAGPAYETTWQAYETERQAYETAWQAYETAREAYETARQAYGTARQAYGTLYAKYLPEIEALHAKECLDCPWDGNTIFPVKK